MEFLWRSETKKILKRVKTFVISHFCRFSKIICKKTKAIKCENSYFRSRNQSTFCVRLLVNITITKNLKNSSYDIINDC